MHRVFSAIVMVVSCLLSGCDNYPQDPEKTLLKARNSGVLEVGLIINPPWVDNTSTPNGVEVDLIDAFCASQHITPRWHVLSLQEAEVALEERKLALVIGGVTEDQAKRLQMASTAPYYSVNGDNPHKHVILVQRGENALLMALEKSLHKADKAAVRRAEASR